MAFALTQPALELVLVFLALGLGLALPYVALCWWPALQARLPRPGVWMDVLKQALAFPLYATAIWLTWVLAQQSGPTGVLVALGSMGLLALAAWLWRVGADARSLRWRRVAQGLAVLALAAVLALPVAGLPESPQVAGAASTASAAPLAGQAQPYSPQRLNDLRAQGQPVFVNLTAAWCISCLVNERVALSRPEVQAAFAAHGITYLKGDWTRQDPDITALLRAHGRSGVPLYLLFPARTGAEAVVLPQVLTPATVLDALAASATGP